MNIMKIDSFRGKYSFLSNFYKTPVTYEGIVYPSAENAFQAAKSLEASVREKFISIEPREAKKLGRRIDLRPDWEIVKVDVMKEILKSKFSDPELKQKLKSTGNMLLIEGNTWGDQYWGFDIKEQKGKNVLGSLLMTIRGWL